MTNVPLSPSDPDGDDPLIARVSALLRSTDRSIGVLPLDAARADLASRIDASTASHRAGVKSSFLPWSNTGRRWRGWAVGSMCVIAVGVIGSMALRARFSNSQNSVASASRSVSTVAGQRATIVLPNGTRASLSPASRLDIHASTSQRELIVDVLGEVAFTVTHAKNKPLIVRTGNALVRVLGTTFSVRRYADERSTRVVVLDGRVSVRGRTASIANRAAVLTANTEGIVPDSGVLRVVDVAAAEYLARTEGRFLFRSTPARDVLAELERAYDVDLRVTDTTLMSTPITWTVDSRSTSLSVVLDELSDLLTVHYKRSGRVITIVRGKSASRTPIRSVSPFTSESNYGR